MDYKKIDQATAFVRGLTARNNGEVPAWSRYQQLVKDHLWDPDLPTRFKMPPEYYYAYLRGKGMSDFDARDQMGLTDDEERPSSQGGQESVWDKLKFWR